MGTFGGSESDMLSIFSLNSESINSKFFNNKYFSGSLPKRETETLIDLSSKSSIIIPKYEYLSPEREIVNPS